MAEDFVEDRQMTRSRLLQTSITALISVWSDLVML